MLAKQLQYLAEAEVAGIVLGASVPIILTSRADGTLARMASCALANLWAEKKKQVQQKTNAQLASESSEKAKA